MGRDGFNPQAPEAIPLGLMCNYRAKCDRTAALSHRVELSIEILTPLGTPFQESRNRPALSSDFQDNKSNYRFTSDVHS